MRSKKLLVTLVIVGVMFFSVFAVLPVKADPTTFTIIDVENHSTDNGYVGDTLLFSGSGFSGHEDISVDCETGPTTYTPLIYAHADSEGNFAVEYTIPETLGQVYALSAFGYSSGYRVEETFEVLPSIVLSTNCGPEGTPVTVEGHGFTNGLENDLTATFDGVDLVFNQYDCDTTTGWFSASFEIPSGNLLGEIWPITFVETEPAPPHTVTASAVQFFTITDGIFVITDMDNGNSHVQGYVDDFLEFTGTDFPINTLMVIGNNNEIDTMTSSSGSFCNYYILPDSPGGTYDMPLYLMGELAVTEHFTVLPSIELSQAMGPAGTTVTVTGHGFSDPAAYGVHATLSGNPLTLTSVTCGSDGTFTAQFTVPDQNPGSYLISFFDSFTDITIDTFTIPPSTPLPEYPFGALLALFSCAAALIVLKKRPQIHLRP